MAKSAIKIENLNNKDTSAMPEKKKYFDEIFIEVKADASKYKRKYHDSKYNILIEN